MVAGKWAAGQAPRCFHTTIVWDFSRALPPSGNVFTVALTPESSSLGLRRTFGQWHPPHERRCPGGVPSVVCSRHTDIYVLRRIATKEDRVSHDGGFHVKWRWALFVMFSDHSYGFCARLARRSAPQELNKPARFLWRCNGAAECFLPTMSFPRNSDF